MKKSIIIFATALILFMGLNVEVKSQAREGSTNSPSVLPILMNQGKKKAYRHQMNASDKRNMNVSFQGKKNEEATLITSSAINNMGYEYTGNIGQYKVVLQEEFFNLTSYNPSSSFCYKYLNNQVNRGDWIYCTREGHSGNYEIWYEWINGNHTGTFKIIIDTGRSIKGTFTNSEGRTYNVSARYADYWSSDLDA